MSNFLLYIYTPNGVVVKDFECESLVIPTLMGEINVLPGHTHILAELSTGILTAKMSDHDRHFSMTAGLCKILGNKITILSTTSESAGVIDIERAKSAKHKAESRLKGTESLTDVQLIKFQRKLARANTRIRMANLK